MRWHAQRDHEPAAHHTRNLRASVAVLVAGLSAVAAGACSVTGAVSSGASTPAGGVSPRIRLSVSAAEGVPSWSPGIPSRPPVASQHRVPAGTGIDRTITFGRSVHGIALTAVEVGNPHLPAVLVIGCIHGNEPAGIAVVDQLLRTPPGSGVHLWLVRTLNPDGQHARTRTNADGVDLNRNFAGDWRPLDPAGGLHYAGPRVLSEPEAMAMTVLLQQIRPSVGIWFHQALDVIDISQGPRPVQDSLAAALGVGERPLPDYPGSAIGYEDHLLPQSAFAFELPAGSLSRARANQIANAILAEGRRLAGPS